MARKTETKKECLKFRGVPISGDAETFVELLKSQFGFSDSISTFTETYIDIYGQFVGEDVALKVSYSQQSKTVYAVKITFVHLEYEDEYKHYKELYSQKYGKPMLREGFYGEENSIFKTEGGKIRLYRDSYFCIDYVNTVNEKLAKKEHDSALLDEI